MLAATDPAVYLEVNRRNQQPPVQCLTLLEEGVCLAGPELEADYLVVDLRHNRSSRRTLGAFLEAASRQAQQQMCSVPTLDSSLNNNRRLCLVL